MGGRLGEPAAPVALVAFKEAVSLVALWPPRALVKQAISVWPDLPQKEYWRSAGWMGQPEQEWVESPNQAHLPTMEGGI